MSTNTIKKIDNQDINDFILAAKEDFNNIPKIINILIDHLPQSNNKTYPVEGFIQRFTRATSDMGSQPAMDALEDALDKQAQVNHTNYAQEMIQWIRDQVITPSKHITERPIFLSMVEASVQESVLRMDESGLTSISSASLKHLMNSIFHLHDYTSSSYNINDMPKSRLQSSRNSDVMLDLKAIQNFVIQHYSSWDTYIAARSLIPLGCNLKLFEDVMVTKVTNDIKKSMSHPSYNPDNKINKCLVNAGVENLVYFAENVGEVNTNRTKDIITKYGDVFDNRLYAQNHQDINGFDITPHQKVVIEKGSFDDLNSLAKNKRADFSMIIERMNAIYSNEADIAYSDPERRPIDNDPRLNLLMDSIANLEQIQADQEAVQRFQ